MPSSITALRCDSDHGISFRGSACQHVVFAGTTFWKSSPSFRVHFCRHGILLFGSFATRRSVVTEAVAPPSNCTVAFTRTGRVTGGHVQFLTVAGEINLCGSFEWPVASPGMRTVYLPGANPVISYTPGETFCTLGLDRYPFHRSLAFEAGPR